MIYKINYLFKYHTCTQVCKKKTGNRSNGPPNLLHSLHVHITPHMDYGASFKHVSAALPLSSRSSIAHAGCGAACLSAFAVIRAVTRGEAEGGRKKGRRRGGESVKEGAEEGQRKGKKVWSSSRPGSK